jgi:hypothetical protein
MNRIICKLALALASVIPGVASTIGFSFNGTFAFDNDVILFAVNLQSPANLSVFTSSYAAGGFTPHLEMWDGTGTLQFAQTDGGEPACVDQGGPAPRRDGTSCGDAWVHEGPTAADNLDPGHYLVSLSQSGNSSDGFSVLDPFTNDGVSGRNYTASANGCSPGVFFCDAFTAAPDSSNWEVTFNLSNVSGVPIGSVSDLAPELGTPEPGMLALVLGGLSLIAAIRYRRA